MNNIRKPLENTGFSRGLWVLLKICKYQISFPSVLQLLFPKIFIFTLKKSFIYKRFACFSPFKISSWLCNATNLFFRMNLPLFLSLRYLMLIYFRKDFIFFVEFILTKIYEYFSSYNHS